MDNLLAGNLILLQRRIACRVVVQRRFLWKTFRDHAERCSGIAPKTVRLTAWGIRAKAVTIPG
jgi:hypothetical protein